MGAFISNDFGGSSGGGISSKTTTVKFYSIALASAYAKVVTPESPAPIIKTFFIY